MQQYRVEFFENYISDTTSTRRLRFIHYDFANDLTIDDDYIAIQTTTIEIRATELVKAGHLIRILRDDEDYFFGLVTNVEPGEYITRVSFRPFVSVFDVDILFDIRTQRRTDTEGTVVQQGLSLEEVIKQYIDAYFVNNSDYRQIYPITVTIPSSSSERTPNWNMGIYADSDDAPVAIIGLYNTLLVRAIKEYGVAIRVFPDFSDGTIAITVGKINTTFHIDANLPSVTVKTLKVNDRPTGINKLVIYNSLTYGTPIIYYVHPDRSFNTRDEDRITPVSYEIRTVSPDGTYTDPDLDFAYAALSAAYETLSGLEFDNLIELEVIPSDEQVKPLSLRNGQKVAVHYKGETYTSILTGKAISFEKITLMFGSERIAYTKKTSK